MSIYPSDSPPSPMNDKLAICIPTYNRATILRDALNHLIPIASQFNVAIYVSDNASTDDTPSILENSHSQYPFVFHHRNAENIGMDSNFAMALNLSPAKYAWLLGDDDRIHPEALVEVLTRIESSNDDLLLLNGGSPERSKGRVSGQASRIYEDVDELLRTLGWHATWISGLVISKQIIRQMNFQKYIGSYFSHFGSLFDALAQQTKVRIYWHDRSSFFPSSSAEFSWAPRVLEIFSDKWVRVVDSLPQSYSEVSKQTCIRAHSLHTGLFSVKGLLNLRAQGAISQQKIIAHSHSLRLSSQTPLFLAQLIGVVPVWLLRSPRRAYVNLRKLFTAPPPTTKPYC